MYEWQRWIAARIKAAGTSGMSSSSSAAAAAADDDGI